MELVGAALGDGVDDSACGATVFRGIVRSVDLKFLHGSLRNRVADAGAAAFFREESLVVVATVNGTVVEQVG